MKKVIVSKLILVFLLTQFVIIACSVQDDPNSKVVQVANSVIVNAEEHSNQLGKHIFDIFEDSRGTLWFGTDKKGVASYDGKDLNYYTSEDGLCGQTVANIAEDRDGVLWFGTYSDMCRYDPKGNKNSRDVSFSGFGKDDQGKPLLGYGWKEVQTDKAGNLWVNSHHGMFQYVDSDFKEFIVPGAINSQASFCNTPGNISLDFIDSKGNLWFGTDGEGVYRYNPSAEQYGDKAFTHFTQEDGLTSNSVMNIGEDRKGNIWFACRNGLNSTIKKEGGVCSYDGNVFTQYQEITGLHDNNIQTLYNDRSGNLWIGATGTGVYKYDGETFKLYKEPVDLDFSDPFNIEGLQSMLEDSKGRIWMGFSGGLFRLEGETIINVQKDGPWS